MTNDVFCQYQAIFFSYYLLTLNYISHIFLIYYVIFILQTDIFFI